MARKTSSNFPSSPSLPARGYLHQLRRQGVEKLSASQLEVVARLDADWAAGREARAARVLDLARASRGAS